MATLKCPWCWYRTQMVLCKVPQRLLPPVCYLFNRSRRKVQFVSLLSTSTWPVLAKSLSCLFRVSRHIVSHTHITHILIHSPLNPPPLYFYASAAHNGCFTLFVCSFLCCFWHLSCSLFRQCPNCLFCFPFCLWLRLRSPSLPPPHIHAICKLSIAYPF